MTPREWDIGFEAGHSDLANDYDVAFDDFDLPPDIDCSTPHKLATYLRAALVELSWWRHFATKVTPDSELPNVGTPLLGRHYTVKSSESQQ